MRPLSPEDLERLAHKRAGAKLGWYLHAAIYLVVNLFLTVLAFVFGYTWTIYPVLGWGLGLAFHGIAVFFLGAGAGVRERLVRRERERLQRQLEGS
ncbi:2TM domain-containing protein [Ramlibacter sp.]|uniref:2TM domain-containing protein n=1 Tax=Ramlibacter sp. TaxID=1917967 RepID=UPI002BFCE294|nr:2TM domain-containing protein [Ramlibacter sp.]HWI84454.1 2TM domain-containing protein [Ramlibacter sp.]